MVSHELKGRCEVRGYSPSGALRPKLGPEGGLGQAETMPLSPQHFGSHNLGKGGGLVLFAGEIPGCFSVQDMDEGKVVYQSSSTPVALPEDMPHHSPEPLSARGASMA